MAYSETGKGSAPRRSGFRTVLICLACAVVAAGEVLAAVVTASSNLGVVDTRRPIVELTASGRVCTRPLGMLIILR